MDLTSLRMSINLGADNPDQLREPLFLIVISFIFCLRWSIISKGSDGPSVEILLEPAVVISSLLSWFALRGLLAGGGSCGPEPSPVFSRRPSS